MAEETEKSKSLVDYKIDDEEVAGEYDSPELVIEDEEALEELNKIEIEAKTKEKKELKIIEDVTVTTPNRHEFIFRAAEKLRQQQQMVQMEKLVKMNIEVSNSNRVATRNLAATAKSLEHVMSVARDMVNTLAQTSKDNLEAQRIRYESLKLEAEKKAESKKEDEPKAQWVHNPNIKESKCHRCNRLGHWMRDCPLSHQNKWFCYYCQAIKEHKGEDCPTIRDNKNREKEVKRKPKEETRKAYRAKEVENREQQSDTDES